MRIANVIIAALVLAASATAFAVPSEAQPTGIRNLVRNGGFEMDWMHNGVTSNTRFLLLDQSDWGYAQADGQPDLWVLPESARLDTSVARFGRASLRLAGEASQVVYLCGETEPTDGGNGYNPFRPRCRATDATADASHAVTMEYADGPHITPKTFEAAFSKGTHDWEYREIVVPPAPDLGPMHAAVVRLIHCDGGSAWFDGVTAEEVENPGEAAEPNLLPDGGPPTSNGNDPGGWPQPQLWNWVRRDYYRFTGWSHEDGKVAGGATVLKATEVGPALQLTVLPGGNLAAAISRHPPAKQPRPISAGRHGVLPLPAPGGDAMADVRPVERRRQRCRNLSFGNAGGTFGVRQLFARAIRGGGSPGADADRRRAGKDVHMQ